MRDPEVVVKGKQTIVLEFLRKGLISQGRAAELLEIDRFSLFGLMEDRRIPVVNMTEEELKEELSRPVDPPGSAQ